MTTPVTPATPKNRLQWKVPTWPGLIGLVGLAATTASQIANVLPDRWRAGLGGASVALVAIERIMQGFDYRSAVQDLGFSTPPVTSVTSTVQHPVTPVVGQVGAPVGTVVSAPAPVPVGTTPPPS